MSSNSRGKEFVPAGSNHEKLSSANRKRERSKRHTFIWVHFNSAGFVLFILSSFSKGKAVEDYRYQELCPHSR